MRGKLSRRPRSHSLASVTALEQSKSELLASVCAYAESKSGKVPDEVDVRMVDLSSELQILAYHEQRKSHDAAVPDKGLAGDGVVA